MSSPDNFSILFVWWYGWYSPYLGLPRYVYYSYCCLTIGYDYNFLIVTLTTTYRVKIITVNYDNNYLMITIRLILEAKSYKLPYF